MPSNSSAPKGKSTSKENMTKTTTKSNTTKGKSLKAISKEDNPKAPPSARTSHNPPYCPYHTPILRFEVCGAIGQGQTPIERFLASHPSEQSSLFHRTDTGKLSTWKGCLCPVIEIEME